MEEPDSRSEVHWKNIIVTWLGLTIATKCLESCIKILSVALTVLIIISISTFLMPFIIFRASLYMALKFVHGKAFGGFLKGADILFELSDESVVINAVFIYRCDREDKTEAMKFAREIAQAHLGLTPKFRSSLKRCCGYYYHVEDTVNVEDVLEFIDDDNVKYLSRNSILDYVQNNCGTIKGCQNLKVSISLKPTLWGDPFENEHGKQHVVVITTRHSMADGPSLASALKTLAVISTKEARNTKTNPRFDLDRKPRMTLDDAYMHMNFFTDKMEGYIFKIEGNSDWQVATCCESERKCIAMIKDIRTKLGVSFGDVINAAISSSILDYMVERGIETDTITVISMVRRRKEDSSKIIDQNYSFSHTDNRTGMIKYKLPFGPTENSMKNKILSLSRLNRKATGSTDTKWMYGFFRNFCTYLPIAIIKFPLKFTTNCVTICTSNMVGFDKVTSFGYPVDDMFVCVPNTPGVGFMFCIFSYDGRLSITATSRRGYVHNREELQTIVDKTFHYIDQASAEI